MDALPAANGRGPPSEEPRRLAQPQDTSMQPDSAPASNPLHCEKQTVVDATPRRERRGLARQRTGSPVPRQGLGGAPETQLALPDAKRRRLAEEDFEIQFTHHGVPASGRERLMPLMRRWGKARAAQLLGLWTALGDGKARIGAAAALQVWGPPGTGKTAVVENYLQTLRIRHVWLNCAVFASLGELNARLIELLRRSAIAAAGSQATSLPAALMRPIPVGQQIRSLDRLENALRLSLQALSCASGISMDAPFVSQEEPPSASTGPVKVVVVLDHAQELPRLSAGALEFLITLPEVLQWGNQLAIVTISRLPLGKLGLLHNRQPPAVAFQHYSEVEAEAVLRNELSAGSTASQPALQQCCRGLMQFGWPQLGRNLQHLLGVGREVLSEVVSEGTAGVGAELQQRVQRAVRQRIGLCDFSGFLGSEIGSTQQLDVAEMATLASLRQMTKAEMRLVLAAYLAGYVEKEDDMQLFMPEVRRRGRKKTATQKQSEELPVYVRAPKATSLPRLLAVYHRLARQPQLLGPPLFEHLLSLREAGLLSFHVKSERAWLDQDIKVACRAQLPLARALAGELDIDLAEYLLQY